MTGFAGRILFDGDADEAKALLGEAIKRADTLRAWKTTQRINSVTKAFSLPGGAYCVVSDLRHMRAMQIVAPFKSSTRLVVNETELLKYDQVGVMDVMSGVVTGSGIVQTKIQQLQTSGSVTTTVDVDTDVVTGFTATTPTAGRYSNVDARRRLAVEEDQMYRPLDAPPEARYSVHAHVKPSCFSGAMRKVAQLVLGLGRPIRPMWEQKWMGPAKRSPLKAKQTDLQTGLPKEVRSPFGLYYAKPALTGRDQYEVPFKFDYRFAKTHGISFDFDGKPWVVEISTRGVLAMPLYLDPVSTTTEGRARYLQSSPELEDFFDEFGGIPLGITFPSGPTFDKWKKAGEVVELLSAGAMSAFYNSGLFGTDVGWTFDSAGIEAHNCCVGFQNGLSTGNHYRVRIVIQRETLPEWSASKVQLLSLVAPKELYEYNKIRRMTESQAEGLVKTYKDDAKAGRTAFDNMTVAPTLIGQAQLDLLRSGFLYHPARPRFQPQIKFPDSIWGGLVSFDFGPYIAGARVDRCDAPMFVCHIDDEIEVVNYFADFRPVGDAPPGINTRQECQFTGTWKAITYGGPAVLRGNFYSSRWDWRKELYSDTTESTYSGRKLYTQGNVSADFFFAICLSVTSFTYFAVRYESTTQQGRGHRVSVAIPFNTRDCYYMAQHSWTNATYKTRGLYTEATEGPQRQYWKLYNFVWHWVGLCGGVYNINAGSIRCIAKKFGDIDVPSCVADRIPLEIEYSVCPANWDGRPVNGPLTVYAPYWNNAIIGSANFPERSPPTSWSEPVDAGSATHEYEIRMISDSGKGEIITEKQKITGKDPVTQAPVTFYDLTMSDWWWRLSPDPDTGAMPWMGVTHSCLGNTIVNYHTDLDSMITKSIGEPANMHAGTGSCYVGVIR